jgi:hypothetical protein
MAFWSQCLFHAVGNPCLRLPQALNSFLSSVEKAETQNRLCLSFEDTAGQQHRAYQPTQHVACSKRFHTIVQLYQMCSTLLMLPRMGATNRTMREQLTLPALRPQQLQAPRPLTHLSTHNNNAGQLIHKDGVACCVS